MIPWARPITVGALEVGDLLTALHALGLRPAALCRAIGLAPAVLRDATARLPASVPVRLLTAAAARTNDPLIGLHAGEVARPRGVIAYLLLSHPRLGEGLRQVAQFSSLPLDSLRIDLRRVPPPVSLVLDPGVALGEPPHLTDYLLMLLVRLLQQTVGAEFAPREVQVRHPPWSDLSAAARSFGCPVRCRQPENRLVLPAGALQARSHLGNPLIADQIAKFAESLRTRRALPVTFHDRVAAVTRSLLIRGVRAPGALAARELHLSERTLRRRLADEQTTFKAVRDRVVRDVAEALLSNPALTVEAVALSVGFAGVAAFSNAFKRWAGTSPSQYRERLVARASGARHTRHAPRARL